MTDLQNKLSTRAVALKPSGIRRFFDIANEMDGVISLGVGEPDFQTPWQIRQAGIRSLENGRTKYTSNWGLIQLRNEIARYVKRKYNLNYNLSMKYWSLSAAVRRSICACVRWWSPGTRS